MKRIKSRRENDHSVRLALCKGARKLSESFKKAMSWYLEGTREPTTISTLSFSGRKLQKAYEAFVREEITLEKSLSKPAYLDNRFLFP